MKKRPFFLGRQVNAHVIENLKLIYILDGRFLGAATGSPYIVFISTSGMLRSSDIYIYIYIYIYVCSYA